MGEVTPTTLAILITVDSADSQTFLNALRELHNETKKLAELLFFDISGNEENPGTFHLIEIWAKDLQYLQDVCPQYSSPKCPYCRPRWLNDLCPLRFNSSDRIIWRTMQKQTIY